jgi:serine protease
VSHRSFRSALVPIVSGLVAVIAVSWPAPAHAAAGYAVAGRSVQAREWWLGSLHVRQTWPGTEGAGITVAVLGTGVDARYPDLAGSVTAGPDYTRSGRTAGGPFWGINGTEVATAIAGHGHGTGHADGLLGVAPDAKILSVRVTLEYNDQLNSEAAIARRLPGAIARGIVYAVNHGARVIDLPLDPGTAGLTSQGSPAAAGGSPAERAAVAYALRKNVVLVAPAGDDGQGPDLVDYPAAYRGVVAVGAVARNGQVASFSSRRSYVSLTAPGVGLTSASPPGGYARISSTSASSGIVAGVAALIVSRFPHLTAPQVGRALTGGTIAARTAGPGAGHGVIDATRAVGLATSFSAASAASSASAAPKPTQPAAEPGTHQPERLSTTVARGPNASDLAGSLVRYVVAGLCVLIVLLVGLLLVMRRRRERPRAAAAEPGPGRARSRGQHEQRRPELVPGPVSAPSQSPSQSPSRSQPGPPGPSWAATGGWQGGSSLGEMQPAPAEPFRPALAPPPKPARATANAAPASSGPPWAPAPEPERMFELLPSVPSRALPPDPGPGIRVPGDMADLAAVPPDAMLPAPFGISASPDPDFPPRPAPDGEPGSARPGLPTRPGLGFAAAPVQVDYEPPQAPDFTVPSRAAGLVLSAGTAPKSPKSPKTPARPEPPATGPVSADPGYIWDLAATDVFPAAADPAPHAEPPGAAGEDGDPGAS